MSEIELLPCPFCGSTDIEVINGGWCCSKPSCPAYLAEASTRAWNTRSAVRPSQGDGSGKGEGEKVG